MLNKSLYLLIGLLTFAIFNDTIACSGTTVNDDGRSFDPCPAPDDFVLPMPGDVKIVFRQVKVPGKSFWSDSRRIVKVGDPGGGIFQGQQKVMIGGSFLPDGAEEWNYYLGKYEISKAQFATVMGDGDLRTGIQRMVELSGDPEDKNLLTLIDKELQQKLSVPVAWVGWLGVQEFINHYNIWCLKTPSCKEKLPIIKSENEKEGFEGFFRLPTELEWEYAARGGASVNEDTFNAELPFNRADLNKYSVIKGTGAKIMRIGTRSPTANDFYDLFGNIQELTADLFQAEMGQGKSGALTARGGSRDTEIKEIRSAYRTEVPMYQVLSSGKISESNASTGFRIALTAPVLPSSKYRTQLEHEYDAYKKTARNTTPVGMTTVNGTVTAVGNLDEISKQLADLLGRTPVSTNDPQQMLDLINDLKSGINKTKSELSDTMTKIDLANQQICENYVKHTVFFSVLMVRSYRDQMQKNNLIEILSKKQNPSAKEQDNVARLQAAADHEGKQIELYFKRYLDEMTKIAECGDRLSQRSLANYSEDIKRSNLSLAEQESFNQLVVQFSLFRTQKIASPSWSEQIIKAFRDKNLLMQL